MSRVRFAGAFLAAWVFAIALAIACGPGSIGDLTAGRLKEAGADADRCPGRRAPPERPTTPDSINVDEIVLAMDDMRIDTGEFDASLPKPTGFDLDKTCDCTEPPSCVGPPDASLFRCEPDGIDNVGGTLLASITDFLPYLEPSFLRDRIHEGVYTIIVSIRNWNGTPNDPKVTISIRMSVGTGRDPDGGLVPLRPKFDGEDEWDIEPNALADGRPYIGQKCSEVPCVGPTDLNAYVRDGTFVANFPSLDVTLNTGTGNLVLPFSNAILSGRITGAGKDARMHGEIAGRMLTDALLSATSALRDPTTNQPVCRNPIAYNLIKTGLCGAADLAERENLDRTGAPCKSLSAVVGFSGTPAKTGVIRESNQDPTECPNFIGSCN